MPPPAASYFYDDFGRFGDWPALIHGARTITYRELEALVVEAGSRLGEAGELIFLEAGNDPQSIITYLACLRAGSAVHLFGHEELTKVAALIDRYRPNRVITGSDVQILSAERHRLAPGLRILLSTSGTTGSPKLVKLSADNVESNARSIIEYLDIDDHDRAITSLRFNYSFGMSVLNSHLGAGAALVLTDRSIIDDEFWAAAQRHGVTSISGVPHSFELLRGRSEQIAALGSLRYLAQAGGRLAPALIEEFAALGQRQGWRFFVMYGQTEASPRMAYLPPELAVRFPDHIGRAIPGGELMLLDAEGRPVEGANRDGELAYAGPNVMMGYALDPAGLGTDETPSLLKTGDIARRNAEGLYKIVGRSARFVKPFGLRINLDEVEADARIWADDVVCAGDDDHIIVASAQGDETAIAEGKPALAAKYKLPVSMFRFVKLPAIPRLSNGKTDYRSILVDALGSNGSQPVQSAATSKDSETLGKQIAKEMGLDACDAHATFLSLGGDSLSYVRVSLIIEDYLGFLPDGWETKSFGDLERLDRRAASKWPMIDTSVFVRAIAILIVVLDHAWRKGPGGAGVALLLVAGLNFSRFQVPKILVGQGPDLLRSTLIRLAIPYFLFVTITLAYHHVMFWPQYLLVSNFTSGVFNAHGEKLLVPYWFMEDYLLFTLIFTLLLSARVVRNNVEGRGWQLAATVATPAIIMGAAGIFLRDLSIFKPFTIFSVGWLFMTGWLIQSANTPYRKALALLTGTLVLSATSTEFLMRVHMATPRTLAFLAIQFGSLALLLYRPRIPMPAMATRILSTVASASLYIYMCHPLLLHLISQKGPLGPALVAAAMSALCGIVLWQISSRIEPHAIALIKRRPGAGAEERRILH